MGDKVKIYSLSTCFHCKAAKALLDQYDMEYVAKDSGFASGRRKGGSSWRM